MLDNSIETDRLLLRYVGVKFSRLATADSRGVVPHTCLRIVSVRLATTWQGISEANSRLLRTSSSPSSFHFSRRMETMSDPFVGQIQMFGCNFAPSGWANCNGQLLPIAQNTALFSLFGTMYGGDGRTTFGLPDLRGRAPIHVGIGSGLPAYQQGQQGNSHGSEAEEKGQAYLAIRFCVSLVGTYPSRS